MITPRFSLRQDESKIYVEIRAPHFKMADLELMVDKEMFLFSLPPYYLRLRFPGQLVDDEDRPAHAEFNSSAGTINVSIPKANVGEEFQDLDMVSKLLARGSQLENQPTNAGKPLIEELDGQNGPSELNFNADGSIDWEIDQEMPSEPVSLAGTAQKYGFDDGYSELVGISVMNGNDINELSSPETMTPEQRQETRASSEEEKFDAEYYLCDLFDNAYISQELVSYKPSTSTQLSDEEQQKLLQLKYKSYILSHPKQTYIAILGFLFGACYDLRTNMGDSTVESAWTIGKLCPQIACLDNSFTKIKDIMISCSRRALAFPLYRHWQLTMKVWDDVYEVLQLGKPAILKMFIRLLLLFERDLYSVYTHIWIQDMTIWIQSANELAIKSLAVELKAANLCKEDVDFDLVAIESEAQEQMQEDSDDEPSG